jgi:hypothetical protein
MKKLIVISLFLSIIFFSCKTPNIVVSNDLKENTLILDAKGRQGWQFNQVIKFGEYYTSKVKRGWTKSSELRFVATFQKAEQKLSFIQFTPNNMQADVLAISKFNNTEIELLRNFLSCSIDYANVFSGVIIPLSTENAEWEFVIHTPQSVYPYEEICGMAKNKKGNELIIKGIRKIEGQARWLEMDNVGFEYILDNNVIGAVSVLNNGKVWIKDSISSELKLVVASLSSALMVRHNMEDSFNK